MSELLPIGSVVKIKDAHIPMVVIGHGPATEERNTYYDYLAVNYPFGLGSNTQALAFDRTAIEQVLFTGYLDERAEVYYRAIDKMIRKE